MKFFKVLLLIAILQLCLSMVLSRKAERRRKKIASRDSKHYEKATSLHDGDRGSIYSLTYHNIDCEGGAVRDFHLFGKTGFISNDNAYEYNCENNGLIHSNIIKSKRTKSIKIKDARDSSDKLSQLNVQCSPSFAIRRFQLKKEGDSIYYEYDCVKVETHKDKCKFKTSNWASANWFLGLGDKTVSNLDEISILQKDNRVLNSFIMIYDKTRKVLAYNTNSCKLFKPPQPWNPPVINPPIIHFPTKPDITSINADCNSTGYISKFSFEGGKLDFKCGTFQSNDQAFTTTIPFFDMITAMCPPAHGLSQISFSRDGPVNNMNFSCKPMFGLAMSVETSTQTVQGVSNISDAIFQTQFMVQNQNAITQLTYQPSFNGSAFGNYEILVNTSPFFPENQMQNQSGHFEFYTRTEVTITVTTTTTTESSSSGSMWKKKARKARHAKKARLNKKN